MMEKKLEIIYNGKEHERAFWQLMTQLDISPRDSERVALIYILTITEDCRNNFFDCYDKDDKCINLDALHHGWVTGTDARAIRLAFNLFNGSAPTALNKNENDSYNLYDNRGEFEFDKIELLNTLPSSIFCDSYIGRYFVEGLKLRFTYLLDMEYEC